MSPRPGGSVAVVGGGVSGLAAARRLARAGLPVTLYEAGTRVGGKLAPVEVGGLRLDGGAESMLARRPEGVGLATELGLADRRVSPTPAKPRLLVGGAPRPLPPSLQGVPTDVDALRPLLSEAGAGYAAGEPDRPAPALDHDVTIGGYVEQRFGPEVVDRLLEPLLGGVYAGRSRRLSFAAVAPALWAGARLGGSLAGHARAVAAGSTGGPVFAGLDGGVHRLVDALVDELARTPGVTLRTASPVTALERGGGTYRLRTPTGTDVHDAVLLAAPATPTARLLTGLVDAAGLVEVAGDLAVVEYASTAVVTLLVRGLAPADSGLLVPPGELPAVKALTYSSAKWDWVGQAVRDAYGEDVAVVRVSVGRAGETRPLQVDDETLVRRCRAEVAGLPGWAGSTLVGSAVTRWSGALPQYALGHGALVGRLREQVGRVPALAVAGAVLDGVGIPACLASAETAVAGLLADLGGPGTDEAALGPGERIGTAMTGETT